MNYLTAKDIAARLQISKFPAFSRLKLFPKYFE